MAKFADVAAPTLDELVTLATQVRNHCKTYKVSQLALNLPTELRTPVLIGQLSLYIETASYSFSYKTLVPEFVLQTVTFLVESPETVTSNLEYVYYRVISKNKQIARDLCNGRANRVTVTTMIEAATQASKAHDSLELTVIQGEELVKKNMNLLYNVGKGSEIQPAMVSLRYQGVPESDEYIALVGKGIIFDTGGYDIKMRMMGLMYLDKCGACNVLAAMQAIAELGLKINVVCALGVAENSISSNSYRPSDIITTMKGFTVEINNTDAEGRLAMASAMTWVQTTYKITTLMQFATLTGAALGALGVTHAAVFSNDDELLQNLKDVSKKVNEPVWNLPITPLLVEGLKHPHADYTNLNRASFSGCAYAAGFLRLFIEEGVKWAHFDIAGTA